MSRVEAAKGNYKEAVKLLRDYIANNPNMPMEELAAYQYYLSTYFKESRQYSAAYDYLNEYVAVMDSVYISDTANALQEIEKRYQVQEVEREYEEFRRIMMYRIIIGIIIVFILIAFLILRARKKRRKIINLQTDLEVMQSQMTEFDGVKATLSNVLDRQVEKETRLHEVLTTKMLQLQRIVDYMYLHDNNPDEFKKKVRDEVVQAGKDEYFGDLHEIVNEKYFGIVDYLKGNYPSLSNDELNICCLVCFGFNNNQIGILFGYTNSKSIFNKRHTLRQKLGLSPTYESLEAFMTQKVSDLRGPEVYS
jgi:tetratricopeptide (TPR) repeat protein